MMTEQEARKRRKLAREQQLKNAHDNEAFEVIHDVS